MGVGEKDVRPKAVQYTERVSVFVFGIPLPLEFDELEEEEIIDLYTGLKCMTLRSTVL